MGKWIGLFHHMRPKPLVHKSNTLKDILGSMNFSDDYHRGALYPFAFLFIFNVDLILTMVLDMAAAINQPMWNFVCYMLVCVIVVFLQIPLMVGYSPYFPRWTLLLSAFFQSILLFCKVFFWREKFFGAYGLHYACNISGGALVLATLLQYFVFEDHHIMMDRTLPVLLDIDPREINFNPMREQEAGGAFQQSFYQFWWPTADLDRGQILPMPAKVIAAVLMSLLLGFMFLYYVLLKLDETVAAVDAISNMVEHDGAHSWMAGVFLGFISKEEVIRFRNCVYLSVAITGAYLIYAALMQPRAWRKKFIEIIYGNPSYNYYPSLFPINQSVRYVGTISMFVVSGVVLQFMFWLSVLYYPTTKHCKQAAAKSWEKTVGAIIYLFLAIVVFRRIFVDKYLSNSDFIYENRSWLWNVTYMWFEIMYFPKAVGYAMCTFVFMTVFWIFSLHRVDVNRMGVGIQSFDMGHITFVSNVRLFAAQILHRYYGFPECLRPGDQKELSKRIAFLEEDLQESVRHQQYHHCIILNDQIKLLKQIEEHMLWNVPLGTRVIVHYEAACQEWYLDGTVVDENSSMVTVEFEDPVWTPLMKACFSTKRMLTMEYDKLGDQLHWKMDDEIREWRKAHNQPEDNYLLENENLQMTQNAVWEERTQTSRGSSSLRQRTSVVHN